MWKILCLKTWARGYGCIKYCYSNLGTIYAKGLWFPAGASHRGNWPFGLYSPRQHHFTTSVPFNESSATPDKTWTFPATARQEYFPMSDSVTEIIWSSELSCVFSWTIFAVVFVNGTPFFNHVILRRKDPWAAQLNTTLSPSDAVILLGWM